MTLTGPAIRPVAPDPDPLPVAPASTLSASAHPVSIEDALRAHLARIIAPARALSFATLSAAIRSKV